MKKPIKKAMKDSERNLVVRHYKVLFDVLAKSINGQILSPNRVKENLLVPLLFDTVNHYGCPETVLFFGVFVFVKFTELPKVVFWWMLTVCERQIFLLFAVGGLCLVV
jgi:hypothetical protein